MLRIQFLKELEFDIWVFKKKFFLKICKNNSFPCSLPFKISNPCYFKSAFIMFSGNVLIKIKIIFECQELRKRYLICTGLTQPHIVLGVIPPHD